MKNATLFLAALLLLGAFGANASEEDSKAGSPAVAPSVGEAKRDYINRQDYINRPGNHWTQESWDAYLEEQRQRSRDRH